MAITDDRRARGGGGAPGPRAGRGLSARAARRGCERARPDPPALVRGAIDRLPGGARALRDRPRRARRAHGRALQERAPAAVDVQDARGRANVGARAVSSVRRVWPRRRLRRHGHGAQVPPDGLDPRAALREPRERHEVRGKPRRARAVTRSGQGGGGGGVPHVLRQGAREPHVHAARGRVQIRTRRTS